ncbi:hypothetical protein Syun_009768 [Stephania yunnanensis]|uniref:Uncharacterized protein n=1 Tax=Stephania yunnanensis TaxID=152371 RepID=A0AAP0KH16_9MAGN
MSSGRGYAPSSGEGSGGRSGSRSSGRSSATRDRRLDGSHHCSHDDATPPAQTIQGHQTGGAGCSRPISTPNEPVELLQRDFQAMQTHILQVMQDHTLTQDHLRKVQGQLNRMEQALMDRLGISFAPAPPRDVPFDDSETDDDLDD